jgi:hypothetical protein
MEQPALDKAGCSISSLLLVKRETGIFGANYMPQF